MFKHTFYLTCEPTLHIGYVIKLQLLNPVCKLFICTISKGLKVV